MDEILYMLISINMIYLCVYRMVSIDYIYVYTVWKIEFITC